MKFVREMVENIVGRGENAGYQHFLLFPRYFQKTSFSRPLKVGLCGKEIKEEQAFYQHFNLCIKPPKIPDNFVIDLQML